jgi:hypothetical protein
MGSNLPGQRTGGRPFYTACGWACLYTLAATPAKKADPPRFALQMVHEWDSCCFQAGNLHTNISQYNTFVQSQITDGRSWFQTSANLGASWMIVGDQCLVLLCTLPQLRRNQYHEMIGLLLATVQETTTRSIIVTRSQWA